MSLLFRKSYVKWSIFKVSDQNKHIWKLQIIESTESIDSISSTSVSTNTTLEHTDGQNLTSSHGKLILVMFPYILWSVPYAGPRFPQVHIFLPWVAWAVWGWGGGGSVFSPLGFRALRKACSGSPQSKVLAKGLESLWNRESLFFLPLLETKEIGGIRIFFFWKFTGYLYLSQDLTSHLHYLFLKLTLETQMRNSS